MNPKLRSKLKKIKDKLYYYFAEKNWGVAREYGPYKDSHPEEHINHPWKLRWMLIRLNFHYRVLRRKDYLYFVNRTERLPYLQGSESEAFVRQKAIHFAASVMKYDVISFDIFDTLILRPFAKPTDLFMVIGKRLNKTEFHRIRIDAEKEARAIALEQKGTTEIDISDIYTVIEDRTGIPKLLGVQTELDVERDYCFANPYMKRVFQILKNQGKTIVITSDMYIPHDQMETILQTSGYTGYDKLYVSCDYNVSKRSTKLYEILKEDYPGKSIVHIGDNRASDISSATAAGIDSKFYQNCHEIGNRFRADGMSPLTGSAYSGIVNTHLHNGVATYSPYYEYGFIYGGLYILGFCRWIHSMAKREKVDKILFLARDGMIYQRIFNMMFDDLPNEYVLWSRTANSLNTLRKNREDFLRRYVFYRAINPEKYSIESLLQSVDMQYLENELGKYDLGVQENVTEENWKRVERLFIDNWEKICQHAESENHYTKDYLLSKIGESKNIAVVDVGWLGSGPLGIKYLIEEEYATGCHVHCWQGAARPPRQEDIIAELMDGTIEPYLFSVMMNRDLFDNHSKSNKQTNNLFFEMFTQAETPSFLKFGELGTAEFGIPDVENYQITHEIHQGIYDFSEMFYKTFQKDDFILNVSGYDAYCGFRMIIRDLSFIKKYFSQVSASRVAGGNAKTQKIETLGEILGNAGL